MFLPRGAITSLATAINDTFLSLTNLTVTDIEQNPNVALSGSTSLRASSYTADTTAPRFVSFLAIDPTAGELQISFNEPVDVSTLDIESIRANHGMLFIRLTSNATSHVSLVLQAAVTPIAFVAKLARPRI